MRTDGGARGNPGPAALGAVLEEEGGKVIAAFGEYIGETTNNEAEYRAVIEGLKKLKSRIGKAKTKASDVQVLSDSELVVKQMTGKYKVENPKIQQFFLQLWNLTLDFKKVSFTAVPREKNKAADRLVNEALDAQGAKRKLL